MLEQAAMRGDESIGSFAGPSDAGQSLIHPDRPTTVGAIGEALKDRGCGLRDGAIGADEMDGVFTGVGVQAGEARWPRGVLEWQIFDAIRSDFFQSRHPALAKAALAIKDEDGVGRVGHKRYSGLGQTFPAALYLGERTQMSSASRWQADASSGQMSHSIRVTWWSIRTMRRDRRSGLATR